MDPSLPFLFPSVTSFLVVAVIQPVLCVVIILGLLALMLQKSRWWVLAWTLIIYSLPVSILAGFMVLVTAFRAIQGLNSWALVGVYAMLTVIPLVGLLYGYFLRRRLRVSIVQPV